MGIWNPLSGQTLGTAMGAIRIDTSDVERAGTVTKASAKQIADAFQTVGDKARATKQPLVALASDINKVRGELVALSAGAGVITGLGLSAAGSFQAAQIQFKGLTGSIQSSTALLEKLRKKASDAGIPFNDMLKASKLLLPTLEGNTEQLDVFMKLAQRVAVLNPAEGIAGAAFAINEALSSGGTDLVSLAERFNISRAQLRAAIEQTGGDMAAALDLVLNRMGITQQTADEMGKSFQASLARAKDSAQQLLGTAFTPLLDVLTPILDKSSEFLMELQETNPELLSLAAGIVAITAAGGPLILMLAQVIMSLQTIKSLSIAGSLGKAGGVGLAVAGGVGLGLEGSKAIGRATGNERLAESGLDDVWNIIKQAVLVMSGTIDQVNGIIFLAGKQLQNAFGHVIEAIGGVANSIAQMLQILFPQESQRWQKFADGAIEFGKSLQVSNEQMQAFADGIVEINRKNQEEAARMLFPELFAGPSDSAAGGVAAGIGESTEQFTQDQLEAWEQYQEDLDDITKRGSERRLSLIEQYEKQVASIEKRRADNLRKLNDDIARTQQEANEAIREKIADHEEWRQETIQKANEDEQRRLEEFNRSREREERQHRENLLDAASRLDALAVINEIRNYDKKRQEADEDFAVAHEQRREELQERLAQEAEAHQEELDEARQATAKRIAELRRRYQEEERAAQERLQMLHSEHIAELNDLNSKLRAEKQLREQAFIEQFNSLAGSLENQIRIHKAGQAVIESQLMFWWTKMIKEFGSASSGGSTETREEHPAGGYLPPNYQHGGEIPSTGIYRLHAQEEVIRPDIAGMLRNVMGGSINQAALVGAVAGGGGMSIGSISLGPIVAPPGSSPADVGDAVVAKLVEVIEGYKNR